MEITDKFKFFAEDVLDPRMQKESTSNSFCIYYFPKISKSRRQNFQVQESALRTQILIVQS